MLLTQIVDTDIEQIQEDTSRLKEYLDELLDWLADKAFAVFLAVIVMVIGFKISKIISKYLRKSFDKSGIEYSVSGFLASLIKGVLYSIVFITAASVMGFQVTSLVTIFGTASLTIGLALQGSFANFAGGVLILIMKPFKVGDYIIENDKKMEGTVVSIDIFYTKLRTYDNKIIVIPNGNITSNSIVNLTVEKTRRIDIKVGIAYSADIKKAKDVLEDVIVNNKYYLAEYEKNVFVDELADSAIIIGVRCYVNTDDYWKAKWDITEQIKLRLDAENIEIAFNQLDVHMRQD